MIHKLRHILHNTVGYLYSTKQDTDQILATQRACYLIQQETFIRTLLAEARYGRPGMLNRHESRLFSQSGQDGILEEIFRRIGVAGKNFVEFGVGAGGGFENNTTFLLAKGWSGFWIEKDTDSFRNINTQMSALIQTKHLNVLNEGINPDNAVECFSRLGVPTEFDLLSIDIDSCDYWVWKSLHAYRPRVVVIEYNSFLPASANWVLPYVPDSSWQSMSMEFGASLKAFELLGRDLGYQLVGCDLTGSDAFFVRSDLCGDKFCAPYTAENHYEPMRYHLIQSLGYSRKLSPTFGIIS